MAQFSFHRPQLATQFCDALAGGGIIDARSGMFLAAPRRVGKSTFLREDLVPEIISRNWFPLYVDLWANKDADPGIIIAEAIKSALASHQGVIAKTAKSVGLDKINFGGFVLDLSKAGLPDSVTVADALEKLCEICGRPIVLIVDEAQHALTTPAGLNLMFALKAARDHLNRSNEAAKLMLVFTGSHRDKLAHLVLKKDQPFFGASITPFPLLGFDFAKYFTDWANESLAEDNRLSPDAVYEAFKLVGHRPEMLRSIIGQIALAGESENLASILQDRAREFHDQMWYEMESDFNSLNPLQKAVLQVMISKRGTTYPPFSEDSMLKYQKITGEATISTASIQSAIEVLRERGLIWNPSRGYYALEDDGLAEWYARTHTDNTL
ncbi:MAG: hypothetical protein WC426_09190 [Sulfuriferula sp.]